MNDFIRGICRTNLDGYEREEWPTHFVAVPRRGERVAAKSGKHLAVVGVTHAGGTAGQGPNDPYILVELNEGPRP